MVNKYNPPTSVWHPLGVKIYADLTGDCKKQGIKSPYDNKVKKKPKLLEETKQLFYEKGKELGVRKVLLDYVWNVQFARQFGLT